MSKLDSMIRFLPGIYAPTTNTNIRGLLTAWSEEDDLVVDAVSNAKDQIFVSTAQFEFLEALGSNVGVYKTSGISLSDDQFRQLIPLLSYYPKQVVPTIKAVLNVFYGSLDNIFVAEMSPNVLTIQIPASIPQIFPSLLGTFHFHAYSGTITNVNVGASEVTVTLDSSLKELAVDELVGADLGQGIYSFPILSNTAGNAGVTIQFSSGFDISTLTDAHFDICNVKNYPGSFFPDPTRTFSVTKQRGVLGQSITAGQIYSSITMTDSSGIPDQIGALCFNMGFQNQEAPVNYNARPSNTSLLIDPVYVFKENHSPGEVVNFVVTPYKAPNVNGTDYSIYLTDTTSAVALAQKIIESIVAAGIVINWIVVGADC